MDQFAQIAANGIGGNAALLEPVTPIPHEVINGIDFYGLGFSMVRGECVAEGTLRWMQKGNSHKSRQTASAGTLRFWSRSRQFRMKPLSAVWNRQMHSPSQSSRICLQRR